MTDDSQRCWIAPLGRDHAEVLKRCARTGAFTVWFMGGDEGARHRAAAALPEGVACGSLGTRLDDAADGIVDDLLNADRQVLDDEGDRAAWSASLIGDRSPYAGDLQLNAARYLVLDGIARAGGRHLFFFEDADTARAMADAARANGLTLPPPGPKQGTCTAFAPLRARASALKTHLNQARAMTARRRTRPAPWQALAGCDVLLVDWAGADSFAADGPTARMGNMGHMADVLRRAGLQVGFIANPLSWTVPFAAIADNVAQAADPVVMADECRSLGAVLKSAWRTCRLGRRLKGAAFRARDRDLTALFDLARRRDQARPQSTLALTFAQVAEVLARHGCRPKAIVHPFENQGWERALGAGVRRHLPGTRLVGYQHAPFATRYIGFFPPRSDVAAGRLPDRLVVMGPRFLDLFGQFGWPQERLRLGGSLRFATTLAAPPGPAQGDGWSVLAATSIELGEALDLAVKAATALAGVPGARLVVNFHPVVDDAFRESVRRGLTRAVDDAVMARVTFSDARVDALIGETDVLLYNSSGAVFDACFAGVKTFYVAVDGRLSYDKVPAGVSRRVHSAGELQSALGECLPVASAKRPDLSVGGVVAPVAERAIVEAVVGG